MGKKRLTIIDLSQEETKKPEKKGLAAEQRQRSVVKTGLPRQQAGLPRRQAGKKHGRLADMGAIMLEEMEKVKEKEKEGLQPAGRQKKVKKEVKKPSRPLKTRSKRYQNIKKLIKPDHFYPLPEAINLLKKMANANFEETVELHLITSEPGKLTKAVKTEKKAPLAHLKIGKTSETAKKIEEKIQALLKPVPPGKIKKAVLTTTMSPGIKLQLSDSKP